MTAKLIAVAAATATITTSHYYCGNRYRETHTLTHTYTKK